MDRGAWWATVHGVTKSQTRLKPLSTHACSFSSPTTRTPVTGSPSAPPSTLLLCPEPDRPVSQGVCDTRSGSDLAPLRARTGSGSRESGVGWLLPWAGPASSRAQLSPAFGTSLCLHGWSCGSLSRLMGRLHSYLICSLVTSCT